MLRCSGASAPKSPISAAASGFPRQRGQTPLTSIRGELSPLGVRITNIEPGPRRERAARARRERRGARARRPIGAEDIADLIAYVVTRPRAINLPQIAIMPTAQA